MREQHSSHAFGPSSAKYSAGPVNKKESTTERSYAGRATATADGTRVELREEKSGALATFLCARANVEVEEPVVDAGRSVVPAIRCHALPFLPLEATARLTTAAPRAEGPGLWFTSSQEPFDDHTSLRRGI